MQGDQICFFFVPIGFLLKIRSGPKEGTFWAPNYLRKLLHFNLNNTFQNMAGSLSFKSGLMLMFQTFKLGFDVDILAFFNLVTCFGYLFKLAIFSKHLLTLVRCHNNEYNDTLHND